MSKVIRFSREERQVGWHVSLSGVNLEELRHSRYLGVDMAVDVNTKAKVNHMMG